MTREEVLALIEAAYAARVAGDEAALGRYWAAGATFEFAGDAELLGNLPGATGPADGEQAVAALMRLVEMRDVEQLRIVVESDKAAIVSRAKISIAGREPFETMLFDFWEFDEAGKVRSVLQFADTAKIASEFAAMAR